MDAKQTTGKLALAAFALITLIACGKKDEAVPAQPGAAPGATTTAATPAPPIEKLSVNELLQRAKAAEKEQRLVAPANNSAMEYFLQVIEQEPSNAQATQALVDLFPVAASVAESAINASNIPEAERIISMLDKSSPNSYTVTTLRAKLDARRAAGERLESDALAAEARRLERLQAQEAAAEQAALPTAAPPIATPPPVAAPPVVVEQPPAAVVTPPPVATTTPAPATTPPATSNTPATGGGQSRDAKLVRQVPPSFPPDAVRKRQSGWVEVRISVGAKGEVTGADVVRAQPSRVFDRAALAAVRQWRFEPALRNGEPVASQRTQRIEFQL